MIVPYYRQPKMLAKQIETWYNYPREVRDAVKIIVVDDCSPEPAEPIVPPHVASLYRIDKDVAWNRSMARNLGTAMAETDWILHVDTDHVLPPGAAEALIDLLRNDDLSIARWYRFKRFRVGAADETRKKDKADPKAEFVEIHPHIDSYLTTKKAYWKAGGYNTRFSGVLGGGSPFLKEMVKANGEPVVLNITLNVYTRHAVPDSSEHTLPRDPEAFTRRKREIMKKYGTLRADPKEALPLPWHKVF
jgi:glycosyltransferase involved in cell wall biosynthesis